ncbi:Glucose--fructose oxidoreductase precursor [Aquisphaera giovannonii]|uniref:Glucose--fructose oxidoreductase n=1 Tax=Aquisphaera giovannonii TaxID=406548 RepID=A0A5B9VXP0_9BACT|nr:Gfo/Idh/MocA family oxidoreductase [Aquisphaera giovannonii]QEH32889.1 Glucose--fructose oxidoreductase precursor [Aquisphaera giovannonii]
MARSIGGPGASRRAFLSGALGAGGAAAFPAIVPARALGREGAAAGERIALGVIGIGPRCTYDLKSILGMKDVRCVAIADVQASRRDAGKALVDGHYGNGDLKLYRDFRELLARPDIDAVLIATGDRWHAPASILAARAGKDVYSEKPCGITIADCQALDDTMRRYARVFQAGTQRRSVPNFQAAVRLAHEGKLGRLHTLYASVYMPSERFDWLPEQPLPPRDVVDWDLWLGPAPWRPYNEEYVRGGWRGHHDFDSGARLLDWAAHTLDLCQWANQADDTMPVEYIPKPRSIEARYANGVKLVLDFLDTPFGQRTGWIQHLGTCPVRFVGEEGWVETGDSGEIEVSSPSIAEELKAYAADQAGSGLDVGAHARNFFDCMRTRGETAANSRVMRRSHIACHAAALSWILGRKLTLDPVTEEFLRDDEANRMRSRAAREPWC